MARTFSLWPKSNRNTSRLRLYAQSHSTQPTPHPSSMPKRSPRTRDKLSTPSVVTILLSRYFTTASPRRRRGYRRSPLRSSTGVSTTLASCTI
ncbi:hypothetical protein B0H12DRAFT_1139764 [Mycena haematopus]|nr:hypothetical protein B0H12DRAFT_1139764 [Mycena haematopus]